MTSNFSHFGGDWHFLTRSPTNTHIKRYYYLTDHLGSVRTTVNDEGTVVHYDDYYPFGAQMPGRSIMAGEEGDLRGKPRYTGHELDKETSDVNGDKLTGLYYAGARYYDPVIGVWPSVDPMADAYPGVSPYAYVLGNPMLFLDPSGACPEDGSEGDAGDGDGYCLANITVEADRYEGSFAGFGYETMEREDGTQEQRFYYDPSTQGGRAALHDHLMASSSGCEMVGADQFSMASRGVGMEACVHSGQAATLDWLQNHPSMVALQYALGGGAVIRGVGLFRGSLQAYRSAGRVFWSGGRPAMRAAEKYARATGSLTLEMTPQGKLLTRLTNLTSYNLTKPLWNAASSSFARSASGTAHVFHNANTGVRLQSIWRTMEYPILRGNNNPIMFHNIW